MKKLFNINDKTFELSPKESTISYEQVVMLANSFTKALPPDSTDALVLVFHAFQSAPFLLTGPGKAVNFIQGMQFTVTPLPQR